MTNITKTLITIKKKNHKLNILNAVMYYNFFYDDLNIIMFSL